MKISFFRYFYFSEWNQSFPSRVENVIAFGSTDQEIVQRVNQFIGSNPDHCRSERVGPLSTDLSLLNNNNREINWLDLSRLVQNANQTIDDGARCLFFDTRQIVASGITASSECCDLSIPYVDVLRETVYLASAYDHLKGVPIAPIYLMKESSFRKAIARFLSEVRSDFNEICISKCDQMLDTRSAS